MKLPATGRRERWVLLVGAGLLITVSGARFVPRARAAHRDLHAAVAAAVLDLADARRAIADVPATRESLSARTQRLVGWAPRLLPATGSETSAELAALAATLAVPHRVRIGTTRALPDSVRGLFVEASVLVEATSDIAGLSAWLAAIGEGRSLLTVRRLSVEAPAPTSPSNRPEELRAEVVLSALGVRAADSTRSGR